MSRDIQLCRRLTLETRVTEPDGAGGFYVSWQALGSLWADVRVRTGRGPVIGARPRSLVTYRIIVRAAPVGSVSRPRPDQRFREGSRVFEIVSVAENDAQGWYLDITAIEGLEA